MKSVTKFFLFFLLFSMGKITSAQSVFEINILQEGKRVDIVNGEAELKKSPFVIEVKLIKLDGVSLYAAFKDSIYAVGDTGTIPGYADIPSMSMAEESFNSGQELITSDDGWAFWFYDPKMDWHRFDKDVVVKEDTVTGTKTIKSFYLPPDKKSLPVSNVTGPLYLFFVSASKMENSFDMGKELQRKRIKINWIECKL